METEERAQKVSTILRNAAEKGDLENGLQPNVIFENRIDHSKVEMYASEERVREFKVNKWISEGYIVYLIQTELDPTPYGFGHRVMFYLAKMKPE